METQMSKLKPGMTYGDLRKAESATPKTKRVVYPASNSYHDVAVAHTVHVDNGRSSHQGYYGSSAVSRPEYDKETAVPGKHEVHNLHGGTFLVDKKTRVGRRMYAYGDPANRKGFAEKSYGPNPKHYEDGTLTEIPQPTKAAKYKT